MKKMRMLAIALGLVLLTESVSYASNVSEEGITEEQLNEAEDARDELKSQLDAAREKLAESKNALGTVSERADVLDAELTTLQGEMEQLSDDITAARETLAALEIQAEDLEAQSNRQYADMKKRIRFMYAHSGRGALESLLTARSLSEFLNRVRYFSDITAYDRTKLTEYADTLEELEAAKVEAAEALAALEALYKVQQEKESELNERIASAQEEMQVLMEQVESDEAASEKLNLMYEDALAYEAELERQKELEDLARMDEIKRQEEQLKEAKRKALEERKRAEEEARQKAEAEAARRAAEEEAARKAEEERKRREEEERKREEEEAAAAAAAGEETDETSQDDTTQVAQGDENDAVSDDDQGDVTDSSELYADETPTDEGDDVPFGYTLSDLILLATIIQCEADGEPYEGKILVGEVVLNRMYSPSFPNTISGVIYQSGQFSPVASGRFATALAAGPYERNIDIARTVLANGSNSNYLFFRVYTGVIEGYVIGHHVFY